VKIQKDKIQFFSFGKKKIDKAQREMTATIIITFGGFSPEFKPGQKNFVL